MNVSGTVSELLSLEGKVAMVTGGGGGIGSAIVQLFLDAGARVASVDLPGQGSPDGSVALDCDLGDRGQVENLFDRFEKQFDHLDILVHCAGITRDGVLWKMSDDAWSDVLRVNLDSAFLMLRRAAPLMRKQSDGAVVLVSSISGERGRFGQANYVASKAGLIGLGRTAARELGRFGVRVNTIAPGTIETAMTANLDEKLKQAAIDESALGKLGRPEDVARAALYLASPMSGFVTGQVLRVDGGKLMA